MTVKVCTKCGTSDRSPSGLCRACKKPANARTNAINGPKNWQLAAVAKGLYGPVKKNAHGRYVKKDYTPEQQAEILAHAIGIGWTGVGCVVGESNTIRPRVQLTPEAKAWTLTLSLAEKQSPVTRMVMPEGSPLVPRKKPQAGTVYKLKNELLNMCFHEFNGCCAGCLQPFGPGRFWLLPGGTFQAIDRPIQGHVLKTHNENGTAEHVVPLCVACNKKLGEWSGTNFKDITVAQTYLKADYDRPGHQLVINPVGARCTCGRAIATAV